MDIKFDEEESMDLDEELGSMEIKPLVGVAEPKKETHQILLRLEEDIQTIAAKNKAEIKINKNLIAHFNSLKAATKED